MKQGIIKAGLYRHSIGCWGEDLARAYLEDRGLVFVDKNVRTPYGEIDLVMSHDGQLVFVEVKTRTGDDFGYPEESITPRKREHMIDSALAYLQSRPEIGEDWRLDVVSVRGRPGVDNPQIIWFENAFS